MPHLVLSARKRGFREKLPRPIHDRSIWTAVKIGKIRRIIQTKTPKQRDSDDALKRPEDVRSAASSVPEAAEQGTLAGKKALPGACSVLDLFGETEIFLKMIGNLVVAFSIASW